MRALKLIDDFIEVPWECEYIGMLLSAELCSDSESLILISQDFSQDTVAENHFYKNPGQLFLSLLEILLKS